MSTSLTHSVRIRDLVHGFVDLTDIEREVVDTPLFQRLRHVRQNDVASFVYPSLNISRFEHSLGCAHVAGRMARSLVSDPLWSDYQKAVELDPNEFQQVVRLYALLHDIGHLPLSHLFELAFDSYVYASGDRKLVDVCSEWFGTDRFAKLHEACGAAITEKLLDRIPPRLRVRIRTLMSQKVLPAGDPLRPIKLLVDSEIDADRIDSTARDGLLAGGEYGTFDGERIASCVRLQQHEAKWRIAFSDKALSSLEALLLDRYRTHTWIHFHHRVVATKVAASEIISEMLVDGTISKEDFRVDEPAMALRDDPWLLERIRAFAPKSPATSAAKKALLFRDTSRVTLLWKNRTEYDQTQRELRQKAEKRQVQSPRFGPKYEKYLEEHLGVRAVVYWISFKPVGNEVVPIVTQRGEGAADLLTLSPLVANLNNVWRGEPEWYMVLLGVESKDRDRLRSQWIQATADFLGT